MSSTDGHVVAHPDKRPAHANDLNQLIDALPSLLHL